MGSTSPRDVAISKAKFSANGLPEIIRAKYKLRILWNLQDGPMRFGEIRKRLSLGAVNGKVIAPRVLSRELKSLAELGMVHRKAYNVIPPRVEYRLTALGRSLLPIISKILEWGARHPAYGHVARGVSLIRSELIGVSRANLSSAVEEEAFAAGRRY